jgi:hypothetical protein
MSQKRTTTRSRKRSEEGAVMLVVMLILLTATALAGVSLQATQYELRAAGFDRTAVQTQYVSEAAFTTSMSWFDSASLTGAINIQLDAWNRTEKGPNLNQFGEPLLTAANRKDANRTQWSQQTSLSKVNIPPLTVPGANNDPIGTFGPRSNYMPGTEDPNQTDATLANYIVEMYDCQRLQAAGTAGVQVNQTGSSTAPQFQLTCVVTSRGRSYLFGDIKGKAKVWQTADGIKYTVNRFTMAHDSRGTFISPPIVGSR